MNDNHTTPTETNTPLVFKDFKKSLFGKALAEEIGKSLTQEEFEGLCRDAENGTHEFFDRCGPKVLAAMRKP